MLVEKVFLEWTALFQALFLALIKLDKFDTCCNGYSIFAWFFQFHIILKL